MNVTHNIQIDLVNPGVLCRIHAVQGDQLTRTALITLTADGSPWSIPTDATIAIRYSKPDGTGGRYDTLPEGTPCWSISGNILTVALAPQMFTAPGCVNAQAEILLSNRVLATFTFQVLVEEDPSATVAESGDYFNWLQHARQQLEDLLKEASDRGDFTGITPNLQIGEVTSLPAGSEPTATIRGTREDPLLDLGIPQGADPIVDATLTQSGQGADAKVTGELLAKKAPLINKGVYTGDINDVSSTGLQLNSVVWIKPETQNLPYSNYGYCETWGSNTTIFYQRIIYTNNSVCQRFYYENQWFDWYWVNPPMLSGTAYMTTDRYHGNPVHKKIDAQTGTILWSIDGGSTWKKTVPTAPGDIGAAPLINIGTYAGDLNSLTDIPANTVAWITAGSCTNCPTGNYAILETWGTGPRIQRLTTISGPAAQRIYVNGSWAEWEWLNAPMTIGVEYRTTERWNAKVIYTKVINCGTLVEGRKLVEDSTLGGSVIIDLKGYVNQGSNNYFHIPSIYDSTTESVSVFTAANTTAQAGFVHIWARSEFVGKTAYVQVTYYKP